MAMVPKVLQRLGQTGVLLTTGFVLSGEKASANQIDKPLVQVVQKEQANKELEDLKKTVEELKTQVENLKDERLYQAIKNLIIVALISIYAISRIRSQFKKEFNSAFNSISKEINDLKIHIETSVKSKLGFVEDINQAFGNVNKINNYHQMVRHFDTRFASIDIPIAITPSPVERESDLPDFLRDHQDSIPNFRYDEFTDSTATLDSGFLDLHSFSTIRDMGYEEDEGPQKAIFFLIPNCKSNDNLALFISIIREYIRMKNFISSETENHNEHLAVSQVKVYTEEVELLEKLLKLTKLVGSNPEVSLNQVKEHLEININENETFEGFRNYFKEQGFKEEDILKAIGSESKELNKWKEAKEKLHV